MAAVKVAVNCCVIGLEEVGAAVAETVWLDGEIFAAGAAESVAVLTSEFDWTTLVELRPECPRLWSGEWVAGAAVGDSDWA